MSQSNVNLNNSDVSTLITYFSSLSGFQRSNRFKVEITPPAELKAPLLFATSVQVPSQVITYYPDIAAPSGPPIQIPLKREYDERFIIEFIVDKNWLCRKFFDDWMNLMFQKTNTSTYNNSATVKYWKDVIGQVIITPLDENAVSNKIITLYDAWPSTIVPTQLMNDTPNDYLTLSIDMNYRYYELSDPST